MAIHSSLNISDKDKKPRSVLKRIERLKLMKEKNEWKETDSVYGLPKIKIVRIKIKKEKVAKETTEAQAAIEAAPGVSPAQPEQAPAKGPAAKSQGKK